MDISNHRIIPKDAIMRMSLIPCKSYESGNPIDGMDYDCEYEAKNGIFVSCDNCICTGGYLDPRTGKRFYRRNRRCTDGHI